MFTKGINDEFVRALKNWGHWEGIVSDRSLFVAIRNEYINIYYQGCSIFKIAYKNGQLISETHYKYLVRPNVKNPYVLWNGEHPALEERTNEILIHEFDLDLLKKSSGWYAKAEKVGLHQILKSNRNVVDVEVALSSESEVETESDDQSTKAKRVADRIDFAAIQKKEGRACIVFFEAKRFDNGELRSKKPEPPVIKQIRKYEAFIQNHRSELETSYRRVCENLVQLIRPDRYDTLVKDVADRPERLTVDSDVRLVVFGFDEDQRVGKVWKKHKQILDRQFGRRLLLKGNAREFTSGISK